MGCFFHSRSGSRLWPSSLINISQSWTKYILIYPNIIVNSTYINVNESIPFSWGLWEVSGHGLFHRSSCRVGETTCSSQPQRCIRSQTQTSDAAGPEMPGVYLNLQYSWVPWWAAKMQLNIYVYEIHLNIIYLYIYDIHQWYHMIIYQFHLSWLFEHVNSFTTCFVLWKTQFGQIRPTTSKSKIHMVSHLVCVFFHENTLVIKHHK